MMRKSVDFGSSSKKHRPSFMKSKWQSSKSKPRSLQITIPPEKIQRISDYIKYFCPLVDEQFLSVIGIANILRKCKTAEQKFEAPYIACLNAVDRFLQILSDAQMDYSDWFRFVVGRSNGSDSSKQFLTFTGFCTEMTKFFRDRRETGFDYELLQNLFTTMTKNSDLNDNNNVLSTELFTVFIRECKSVKHQIRAINATALELHPVRYYILKNNVSLQNILDVTNSEVIEGKINVSQLEFLISSLILMFEIYCDENGTPSEKEIAQLDKAEKEKERARREGEEASKNAQMFESTKDRPRSPKKRASFAVDQLVKMVSSVGLTGPPDFSLISTISSIKRSFSIRTSFVTPAVEPDADEEDYDEFNTKLDDELTTKPSLSFKGSLKSQKSIKNFPVEINSEFMTSLKGDERMKVVSLLKHMADGEEEEKEENRIECPPTSMEKPPLGKMASAFLKGVSSKFLLTGSGSTKSSSMSSQPSSNFIVIDTSDDVDELDYLRFLSATRSLSTDEYQTTESPPKDTLKVVQISESKRKTSINHKNYYEDLKHTMLDHKDDQIHRALKLNKAKMF